MDIGIHYDMGGDEGGGSDAFSDTSVVEELGVARRLRVTATTHIMQQVRAFLLRFGMLTGLWSTVVDV